MTPEQLTAICDQQESMLLKRVILTMPEPKSGLRGEKVRTPFGLGEVHCVNSRGEVVFSIEVSKIRKFLARIGEANELHR